MKLKLTALLFIAAFMTAFSSHAATLAGKHYEGIGKVAGQAIDFWVTIDFDDEDAEYKVAGAFNISGAYTVSKTAAATTVSVKSPGGKTNTLKSTDGGSSFEGSVTLNGKVVKLWVLEVPASHKACDLPAAELTNVIASTEGYTSFIRVNLPNGAQMCVTSDFKFNADGTYTLTCDTPRDTENLRQHERHIQSVRLRNHTHRRHRQGSDRQGVRQRHIHFYSLRYGSGYDPQHGAHPIIQSY